MSNFDIAFDRAIAKTSPVPMSDLKADLDRGTGPLEEMFHAVDHFSYDPTRLVVSATVVGEQYRSLKTNLVLFKDTEGVGSIVFSSSLKNEGKTTVVVNTAREFGHERDAKIAVVDCDFKRPGVARFCGVECHAGIEDVLAEEAELEECGIYSRRDNYTIFPVSHRPSDTGDLLTATAIQRVVGRLETIFDFIFFDTSPVLSTSEPLILGAKTGGVVLVVRANQTQRESVLYAQGQLEQAGCRLLGVVLNARPSYVPRLWLLRKYEYFSDAYRYKAD